MMAVVELLLAVRALFVRDDESVVAPGAERTQEWTEKRVRECLKTGEPSPMPLDDEEQMLPIELPVMPIYSQLSCKLISPENVDTSQGLVLDKAELELIA
jgi:hypothetical protein